MLENEDIFEGPGYGMTQVDGSDPNDAYVRRYEYLFKNTFCTGTPDEVTLISEKKIETPKWIRKIHNGKKVLISEKWKAIDYGKKMCFPTKIDAKLSEYTNCQTTVFNNNFTNPVSPKP